VRRSRDALVVVGAILAMAVGGVGAWWMWSRNEPLGTTEHSRILTRRDLEGAPPPGEPAPHEATNATRAPSEFAPPAAPASDATNAIAPDEPIRGIVVDPANAPIAGATVQAMDWLGAVAAKAATNAKGEFAFGKLPPDARHLHAAAPGRRSAIVFVGDPGRWPKFPSVTIPARIVLEPGVVAVARLRWSDGTPCAGVAVHLGAAKLPTTGIDHEPKLGPWPPPITDENGRVEIDGLPPDRIIGLGIDLLGRNEDSPRPFETGHATSEAEATEQLFTWPKLAKLTVELHGLEEMEEKKLKGTLAIARVDGFKGDAQQWVPPFTRTFERVVLGGQYHILLLVEGRKPTELARRLRIVDADQDVSFDCVPPPIETTPIGASPWTLFRVRLLQPDESPITEKQLAEVNLSSHDVRVRYGSLAPERRDAKERADASLDLSSEGGKGGGLTGRLGLREAVPVWIEAELGPLRSRVELDRRDEKPQVDFTFDLATLTALTTELTRLSFRAHDVEGRDVQLARVLLKQSQSTARSHALPLDAGPILRLVSPGAYHYQCFAAGGGFAEGDVDVPAGSPVTVDVVVPDPGDVCGTVAPLPDALRVLVTRTPLHGERNYFNWWDGCVVGPDGSYSLDGVPPGEWRLMLTIVSSDETTARVEVATVTVKSNAITRHDFTPSAEATKRFRFDFGAAKRALVHVTDEHEANLVDGAFTNGAIAELPPAALRFSATPEIRDERTVNWDLDHWTEGTITAVVDGVAVVRFEFPAR
jgi:hypothetical protein